MDVSISEEMKSIKTYPFSDPNPIPMLVKDSRLYPYHSFDGYSHEGKPQEWNVLKLENPFIEVTVLPEVGGKVWGAIDKSNGEEFIYRNEVIKFRNIALRGPWTSGGIEFNFGVIGHTPSTATPVDYITRTNLDESVSVFVGAMDLPSRTHWRVEINLKKDRSSFETTAIWYNPTPHTQPYYNWMTAAAFARDDLEVAFPGNQYLKHGGEVNTWPVDNKGRDLSFYDNNRFEGHKSYHVVGEQKDFFGGYYHDAEYGFGHWAPYEEMPGQKLWLWALSRQGGIWEDLLTDTDGQYIEFQAGRQFVQFSPSDHVNPVKKAGFEPHASDSWSETWFPLKGTGGVDEASSMGAMGVEKEDNVIRVKIHSFIEKKGVVEIISDGRKLLEETVSFFPMELKDFSVSVNGNDPYKIKVNELNLHYKSDRQSLRLKRPFSTDSEVVAGVSDTERMVNQGMEYLKARRYGMARETFKRVLAESPNNPSALKGMADLYFRSGEYNDGLNAITKVLQLNTYDAEVNFMAGNLYRAVSENINAKESFGWAARSVGYRSAAYTQMSEIAFLEKDYDMAQIYATKAISYNDANISALQVLALSARKTGARKQADQHLARLLEIDPLHHFANLEKWFLQSSTNAWKSFKDLIKNEFAQQTFLELAIAYHNRGMKDEAVELFQQSRLTKESPLLFLWLSYLIEDKDALSAIGAMPPDFVFPYRRETIPVLQWAVEQSDDWKFRYYLALNLWAKNRHEEALQLMKSIRNRPDYGPFYLARVSLKKELGFTGVEKDLKRSLEFNSDLWQGWLYVIKHYQDKFEWNTAYDYSIQAMMRFPNNFNVEITHARSLLFTDRHNEAVELLRSSKVLPSEHSRSSRQYYEWALIKKGLDHMKRSDYSEAVVVLTESKEWPENLGVGRPYDPDERLQEYLLGVCYERLGKKGDSSASYRVVVDYTREHPDSNILRSYLGYDVAKKKGESAAAISIIKKFDSQESVESQWIRAKIISDSNKMKDLERLHPEIFRNFELILVKEAVEVSG